MTPPRPCWCLDLGQIDYLRAHALQLDILEARLAEKITRDVMLLLEHPAVFTIGRRGAEDHLKVSSAFLAAAGIRLHHIERGGDITFHGPGQLVLYPIVSLRSSGLGVLGLVESLEEAMIRTAADWGVPATRDPRNRGVWVGNSKLGSIGIAVRRGISFHGMALNVDLPLEPFTWITPCGLQGIDITTLNLEANRPASIGEVKTALQHHIENILSISLHNINCYNLNKLIK